MPDLSTYYVFPFFLLFARFGSALMIFPFFADVSINQRTRLLLALFITAALFPLLQTKVPLMPDSIVEMVSYVFIEVLIGIFLAITARIFMTVMTVGGELIAYTSGFQAASLFDPQTQANNIAPAVFLGITSVLMVLAMNLHHVMLEGVVLSYEVMPVGQLPEIEGSLKAVLETVKNIFIIGIKLAAPVMVTGFLGYIGFGIFNRLIPQFQAFFVSIPLTIVLGIFVLGVALGGMLTLFTEELQKHIVIYEIDVPTE